MPNTDVQIGSIDSTVRAVDSMALFNPQVIEQLLRLAVRRMREEQAHDDRVRRDRRLETGVSEPETISGQG